MSIFSRRGDEGYTRGGLDVESAINLFFKGVLLFPIFLFAGYVGVAMMKHMIFHGVPVMNNATPEQHERLRERDSQVGLSVVEEESKVVQQYERDLSVHEQPKYVEAMNSYRRDYIQWRKDYERFVDCGGQCMSYPEQPSFGNYYK